MNICRICLAEDVEKDISQLTDDFDDKSCSYNEIMLLCLNIEIDSDSKITSKLCMKCYLKILSFYKFKLLALKSDEYLRSLNLKDETKDERLLDASDIDDNHEETVYLEDVKFEVKQEESVEDYHSDDELLSVIKKMKYENTNGDSKADKENGYSRPHKKKYKRNKGKLRNRESEHREQICDECGKTVRDLKAHMYLHKPETVRKRFKCKDETCDKMFSSLSARGRHYKIKHLGIKKHCNICNKDVVSLSSHQIVVHNRDSAKYPCVPCGRRFISRSALEQHLLTHTKDNVVSLSSHQIVVHNRDSAKYPCVPCGRRFISRSALEQHLLTHTKDRPFVCETCEKTFKSNFTLLQHIRQVHHKEKTHLCQYCSKSFFKKYHLQLHIRSHSKEKPCKCPECGRCFYSTSVLRNHMLTHTYIKKYACQICNMTFARSGNLKTHMISHTKEKRHSCKYCGVRFGRSDHKLRHERTAHEKNLRVDVAETT